MEIDVTFVGTATVLIRVAAHAGSTGGSGLTLLTDPNFLHQGQHAYLGYGLVSRRLRPPAMTVEELPPLDAVVLSHLHGDHWDRVAERGLRRDVPIITTHAAARRLRQKGFREAQGLGTWDTWSLDRDGVAVTMTALPGRHAPIAVRRLLPPVMGTMLEFGGPTGTRRLYLSGDTLLIDELSQIPARFEAIDAGVLHLGGTRLPAGGRLPFGVTVTMDGRQGAEAVERLGLPTVIPVHFDDYGVFASPLSEFVTEMERRGMGDRVVLLERGVTKGI